MAILHVRNVPEELSKRSQKLAHEESRSVSAEVNHLSSQGLQACEARQGAAEVIVRIQKRSCKIELPLGWQDSAELLREDRNR
jgi:plasmid stability protein